MSTDQLSNLLCPHSNLYHVPPFDESLTLPPLEGKGDESTSPLPSPDDERHSIYDNVPLIICNKSYQDYQQDLLMDSGECMACSIVPNCAGKKCS